MQCKQSEPRNLQTSFNKKGTIVCKLLVFEAYPLYNGCIF